MTCPARLLALAATAFALAGPLMCAAAPVIRDVASDTWTAVDALGRRLPGAAECPAPRPGKFVGMFYFVWHGQHGTDGPFDITKILAAGGEPQWGLPGAFHHWGEPEMGYYLADDPWVIRRNAQMLSDAGVDVIILDVTNAVTYPNVCRKLLEEYREMRREGERTPQVCFITHADAPGTVKRLWDEIYSRKLCPELWFQWEGKPLLLSQSGGLPDEMRKFFTFRESWAWSQAEWFGDGHDRWPWLDNYPQNPGWHVKGVPEAMAVCVAQHPVSNIGRSFHAGKEPEQKDWKTAEGLCFTEQWERALQVDPAFVFVTGWNEWVAQRFLSGGDQPFLGKALPKGGTFFVDQYNQEFSRDIEPMKGGHTDDYYYQLISFVRRYKGVSRPEPAGPEVSIRMDGRFEDWAKVRPDFRDHAFDTQHRDWPGWGKAGRYVDHTGRNDFLTLKVARDSKNVYFYARTREPISPRTDPAWMMLLIDIDSNPKTGWMGYDFMVNGRTPTATHAFVQKNLGGWKWSEGVPVCYKVAGRQMEIAIPRSVLGLEGKKDFTLDFHWVDNLQHPETEGLLRCGDSAPDRRFNYRYFTSGGR